MIECYDCLVMENIRNYFLNKERAYETKQLKPYTQEDFNELEILIIETHEIKQENKKK